MSHRAAELLLLARAGLAHAARAQANALFWRPHCAPLPVARILNTTAEELRRQGCIC